MQGEMKLRVEGVYPYRNNKRAYPIHEKYVDYKCKSASFYGS